MKKLLALLFFCLAALTPAAFAEDGGALLTLKVDNIQVEAKWSITPAAPFSIHGGILRYIGGVDNPNPTAVFTVTVEDNFKVLNSQYDNLAAVAVLTIELFPAMFIIGGFSLDGAPYQDVWSSSNNGADWSITNTDDWSLRYDHSAVKHNGKIYVLGGIVDGSTRLQDVWSSPNGETWSNLGNAPWSTRGRHQSVVHNGKIYVLGGNDFDGRIQDVWSSADGITWSESPTPDWSARDDAAAVVHNGTIYVMGGETSGTVAQNDIWASADGESWSNLGNADWSIRYGHRAVVHNDKIYVIGGRFSTNYYNDVWSWTGSGSWQKSTPEWSSRYVFSTLSHKGLLYVIGGLYVTTDDRLLPTNDVWSSSDGQSWTIVPGTKFPARSAHQTVIIP